ncbi:MAG: DoxX family membrane protein [Dehalococcoidia bacterium]|nr:DoxX family membrane protein [Dehalococcoidia bacterium]
MSKPTKENHQLVRSIISLIAGIIVGVTFLIAGSGKIFAFGDMPGQTMQFIGAILPDAWLTPGLAYFLGEIFFPYIIPWTELCLGVLLLARVWPRFFAALTLPLIAAFMANNAWFISQGRLMDPCDCWGIWAWLLGTPTHLKSLGIDIILFVLALTIVLVHPAGFFSSPPWLARIQKGPKGQKK